MKFISNFFSDLFRSKENNHNIRYPHSCFRGKNGPLPKIDNIEELVSLGKDLGKDQNIEDCLRFVLSYLPQFITPEQAIILLNSLLLNYPLHNPEAENWLYRETIRLETKMKLVQICIEKCDQQKEVWLRREAAIQKNKELEEKKD